MEQWALSKSPTYRYDLIMRKRQCRILAKSEQSILSIDPLLCEAIRNKRLIEFEYQRLKRVAEPHDYGIQNGIQKLLVYQMRGESRSGRIPDWRLVVVSSMKGLRILDQTFRGSRAKTVDDHKKWDQVFARVAAPGKDPED